MTQYISAHEYLTTCFDNETFLYHAVADWREGGTTKEVKINVVPTVYEEAQHYVDSISRLVKEGKGDFTAVSNPRLHRFNIPLSMTEDDRTAVWWRFRHYLAPMRKHDCWLLTHYRLRVLDSEALDPEDALVIQLRALQRQHEERRGIVVEVAMEWAEAHAAALASDEIPTYLAHEMKRQAFTGLAPGGC